MDAAAVAPDNSVARVELYRSIEVGNSAGKIAAFAPRLATIIPGLCVAWVEHNRMAEVADRHIDFAQRVANESANEVGLGVTRVQFDGPVKIAERRRQIAFAPPRETTVVVSDRRPRIKRNG